MNDHNTEKPTAKPVSGETSARLAGSVKVHKTIVHCVLSPMGMTRGVGIDEARAWAEAANNSGLNKDAMIAEGFTLRDGMTVDAEIFKEMVT